MNRLIPRIITYAVIAAPALVVFRFTLDYFDLFDTDVSNARYLLSAMAQSQAAVIAIVITVSLVAVQLGASTYSPRVVSIFKSNPDLWVLLLLYGGSISYDLFLLMTLDTPTTQFHILPSYFLCAVAFFALFPYMLSMVNVLSPRAIIGRLLEDVRVRDVRRVRSARGNHIDSTEADPFQPVVDIIRGAFVKYDYETARMGLRRMTARVIDLIKSYDIDKYRFVPGKRHPYNPFTGLSENYCGHLTQIGRLFTERDEELTLESIGNLARVAQLMTEKRLGTEDDAVRALGSIGKICAQREFREATDQTLDAIRAMAIRIPCDDYTITWPDGYKYAFPYGNIMERVVDALADIAPLAVKKWGVHEVQAVGRSLAEVGMAIAREGLVNRWRVIAVASTFRDVGIIGLNVERSLTRVDDVILSQHVIEPLYAMGKIAHEEGMMPPEKGVVSGFERVVWALWDLGTYAAAVGLGETASESARALGKFAVLEEELVEEELAALKHRQPAIESLTAFQEFVGAYKKHQGESE